MTSGDVVVDLGAPRRLRGWHVATGGRRHRGRTDGLDHDSAAQTQHIRAVATTRVHLRLGNIGPVGLAQVRDTLAVLLEL